MNATTSTTVFLICLACITHAAEFECRWASTPPKLDGKLDEAVWKDAQLNGDFRCDWLPAPDNKPPSVTKARLLWDREYLYFSAELQDTDLYANDELQDGAIWQCDVFELFFKPAIDKPGYYELEVNAANRHLDMFLPSGGSGGYYRHAKERPFHIESAVTLRGTLNNWADKDKGWTVEGRVPWRDFLPTGGRPSPGEVWQHAQCRIEYSAGIARHTPSTNAKLTKPDFHQVEGYVPITFIGPKDHSAVKRALAGKAWLAGSPEPPLPYRTTNAFPKLQTTFPITVVPEVGRDGFLLLENNGYGAVRKSRLVRFANDAGVSEPEVLLESDESIYDMCFHPRFSENGFIFIGANGRFGDGVMDFNNRVLRYKMDRKNGRIDEASRRVLMEFHSHGHNGMALLFGKDGMMYLTSGDGTSNGDEWNSGQDLTRLLSKLMRIDVDHPSDGRAYSVPTDNPFVGQKNVRPETWAYGFRNPWRMTMDRETGELWVGENGQDLWEYARIAKRGENYGWPVYEGSHEFHQQVKLGSTPVTKPLIEHAHTDFRSLTGGIVYRGTKHPGLIGCYIYGDHSTGQIWAAQQKDGKLTRHECIADTALGITGFCETKQGDVLIVDYLGNAVHVLEPQRVTVTQSFPSKLSETGFFTNTARLTPHAALIRYQINAPAWHDGATSERLIALPDGERMDVKPMGGWNLPDGAAIVQTLTLNKKRIETRVLRREQGEWSAFTYAWNDVQTDATLVPKTGETRGDWRIPSRQECMFCHSRAANFVPSVSTVQLNRDDQIATWERNGWLKFDHAITEEAEWRKELTVGDPTPVQLQDKLDQVLPTAMQRVPDKDGPLLPTAPDKLPRLINPADKTATLNDRARAYLHANCSHCHQRSGGGNSTMELTAQLTETDMHLINAAPDHASLGIPDVRLIAPGAPGRSLLIYRTAVRGPGQMPPVGTIIPDAEGIVLLVEWVKSLSATPNQPTKP